MLPRLHFSSLLGKQLLKNGASSLNENGYQFDWPKPTVLASSKGKKEQIKTPIYEFGKTVNSNRQFIQA